MRPGRSSRWRSRGASATRHQPRWRQRSALHDDANQQQPEDEGENGRRSDGRRLANEDAAEQQDRQQHCREHDGFTGCPGHFRSRTRIGLKSDASCRQPASSSALSSSPVRIPRLSSSITSRPSGASAERSVPRRLPYTTHRRGTDVPSPAGSSCTRCRTACGHRGRRVGSGEGHARLDELIVAKNRRPSSNAGRRPGTRRWWRPDRR